MQRVNVIASVGLMFLLSGCERWELDRQMEELCKKDGGINVYETVTLSASEFSKSGAPLSRYIPLAKSDAEYFGPDYRYVREAEILFGKAATSENGKGQLIRFHQAIYRKSDERLLGESVWYIRSGGNLFNFGLQPGGKSCPRPSVDLARSVFLKGK